MIVQYNTSRGLEAKDFAPYALNLSRDRVTMEGAAVHFIDPSHPILTVPNKITTADFDGWVQERGLYFRKWLGRKLHSSYFMEWPGEEPKKGSLLIADYGKGLSFILGYLSFRQLPAGVPGAYRLFANIISYSKMKINRRIFYLLALPVVFLLFSFFHEYHVSIMKLALTKRKVPWKLQEKYSSMIWKKALLKEGLGELQLDDEKESGKTDTYISNYLSSRFEIHHHNKLSNLNLLKRIGRSPYLVVLFWSEGCYWYPRIEIVNKVFIDLFDDQQNIHYFTINGVKKSLVLSKEIQESILKFDAAKK